MSGHSHACPRPWPGSRRVLSLQQASCTPSSSIPFPHNARLLTKICIPLQWNGLDAHSMQGGQENWERTYILILWCVSCLWFACALLTVVYISAIRKSACLRGFVTLTRRFGGHANDVLRRDIADWRHDSRLVAWPF